jgi:hypothetical protein
MPEWKVAKTTTLFAQEVIPRIRARLAGRARAREGELATAGVK